MSRCLITGCGLFDEANGNRFHGDLHEEGDCYIFYSVQTQAGQAKPVPKAMKEEARTLFIPYDYNYFERQGVFVLWKRMIKLSAEAKAYIDKHLAI